MGNHLRTSWASKGCWPIQLSVLRKAFLAVYLALLSASIGHAAILNFEGLPDSTLITTQYVDVTFQNTLVLTAGLSLNEFEFPPVSGTNVVIDMGGPILLSFLTPVTHVGGFFTYLTGLNFLAFDITGAQVAATRSAFNSNLAISGDPGSRPNEFLELTSAAGIARASISGDATGGSFTLDNLTYRQAVNAISEPASFALFALGFIAMLGLRRVRLSTAALKTAPNITN